MYRSLTTSEIDRLKKQECHADRWETISVVNQFIPDNIQRVRFSGHIRLGLYNSVVTIGNDRQRPCGIFDATIADCEIGDQVYISNVMDLSGYRIESGVVINNVARLYVEGASSFGNGIEIDVMNASGGRRIPIFEKLSAQLAYFLVLYRDDPSFTSKLMSIIQTEIKANHTDQATIRKNAQISDSHIIKNVNIGESARISGAVHLEEGTIGSEPSAPSIVDKGVVAKGFIMRPGAVIESFAYIEKSFIGEGVHISKQFSSEDSLFFANSECFHGEACNILAGPFSVSHHKSTLLIAGMFSFFNAGSGSNQSNHMYKLGPIHQGILERGCKTGSFSYLLWPSRVGPFSVIIGKHLRNFDSGDFPFSYILDSDDKTVLVPALNFFTIGVLRDSQKFQQRDRRSSTQPLDLINFELMTPYIIHKIMRAMKTLEMLDQKTKGTEKYLHHDGWSMERPRIRKAIKDYQTILNSYIGEQIITLLESNQFSDSEIRSLLFSNKDTEPDGWTDIAGLLAPKTAITEMRSEIKNGQLSNVQEINQRFSEVHSNFNDYAGRWFKSFLGSVNSPGESANDPLVHYIEKWREAAEDIVKRRLRDISKEYAITSRIGYGIDGDASTALADFEAVNGSSENDPYVNQLNILAEQIPLRAERAISLIREAEDS